MASLFKKPNSPFWYLKHKVDGKWKPASTGLRHDDPNETKAAAKLRAEAEAKELGEDIASEGDWDWVQDYLQSSGLAKRTIEKYVTNWGWLHLWLLESKLAPGDIRYEHSAAYIKWRVNRRKKSGKKAGRNTAIQEIKLLSSILNEAVPRRLITANPLVRMKLRPDKAKKKPDLTDDEVFICRKELTKQAKDDPETEWMLIAFEIALETGCRLRETCIPLDHVHLELPIPEMTFPSPKGGEDMAFTIPVPTNLVSLFQRMKDQGQKYTIEEFPFQPSRKWQKFFRDVGLKHLTFHCLRVTKVTRMRREGVPREVAMRLVNHSTELIHLLYDRHRVSDLAQYRDAGVAGRAAAK